MCTQLIFQSLSVTIVALHSLVSDCKERQLNVTDLVPKYLRVIAGWSIVGGPLNDPPLRNEPKWKSVTMHAEP